VQVAEKESSKENNNNNLNARSNTAEKSSIPNSPPPAEIHNDNVLQTFRLKKRMLFIIFF